MQSNAAAEPTPTRPSASTATTTAKRCLMCPLPGSCKASMRARPDGRINSETSRKRQASTACPRRWEPQKLETFLGSMLHPRELETEADEEAQVLRLRRGDVTLVADFGNRRVEFSPG